MAKSVGSDEVSAVVHSRRKLFGGFSSIDLQIDELENNDGKESSPQLYFVFNGYRQTIRSCFIAE